MSSGLPFAVMVLEREPITLDDLPSKLASWVQDVGGFAAIGVLCWLIAYLVQRPRQNRQQAWPAWMRIVFLVSVIGATLSYIAFGIVFIPEFVASLADDATMKAMVANTAGPAQSTLLTTAGAFALCAAGLSFVVSMFKLRPRRIWAIAHLSFTEARRRKVYWAFAFMLLFFLFADWFLPHKPESQLQVYVETAYLSMAVMLLVTAGLLASFSIPNDIRHQTIHTIVTKPVERFEIVVGRFAGYVTLMTVTLALMAVASLIFIQLHAIHPDAEFESYRARVPLYGDLQFQGKKEGFQGESVGREWEYRRYIAGGPNTTQRAVWIFRDLPTRLKDRSDVPCEFAFDIFRTRKADQEGQGVFCTFTFMTPNWTPANLRDFEREREEEKTKPNPLTDEQIADKLAEKYGYFEFRSKEITDYHTLGFKVPAGLFRNAQKSERAERDPSKKAPLVVAFVRCESASQFIGVARHDLYLLDAEGYFSLNFFKGAIGMWCSLCLVIGVAVACSTYLSGVISFVCTMFLFLGGLVRGFMQDLAFGRTEGGGPAESFLRLVNAQNQVTPLDPSPAASVATVYDVAFRWFLRRILNIFPDVEAFDFTEFVAKGFDISMGHLAIHLLVLAGYLLPWAVLAYYLMRSREVAS
ncbi:MAG: hypothetical protein K2R98_12275 [Gemmataceae bacterium]|nr:hypothetical protein [Gemmataceae bacterium]